jgi:hypothetical protein
MNDNVSSLGDGYWGDVMSVYSRFYLSPSECFTSYAKLLYEYLESCGIHGPLSLADLIYQGLPL